METRPIRVLIVDDSVAMCRLLAGILSADAGIEVAGVAPDAATARQGIKALNPDVVTLDVELPQMDGITFLRRLMRLRPMPVIMISALTASGAAVALDALAAGAVDCMPKPSADSPEALRAYGEELVAKVRMAASARVRPPAPASLVPGPAAGTAEAQVRRPERVIAIGASTGGTEAIKVVLQGLDRHCPGIVVVQHLPKSFTRPFAQRLDGCSPIRVAEAEDGQPVRPGHAYVAPGDRHLRLQQDGAEYRCRVDDGEPVNRHRPSVDVLFRSVARAARGNAIGVLLTGMGADGALGLRDMREAGALTIAQDEASSVVWGMPGQAVAMHAVREVLPLSGISQAIRAACSAPDAARPAGARISTRQAESHTR